MSDSTQEELHDGPIKTPRQLLVAAFFSFVVPVAIIMGLVAYVASDTKPSGSTRVDAYSLGGLTAQDLERGVSERLQKVGTVEIRDANRPLKAGEEVFKVQCAACHVSGAAGAPKVGDTGAWSARIRTGFETLVTSALKGKGAMPAQAGGDFEDIEIARAVAYLANTAGGKFAEPNRPAAAEAAAGGGAPAAAAPAAAAPAAPAPAAVVAAAPTATAAPAAAAPAAAAGAGEALYKQACMACHAAGVAGAPKFGDKAQWAPRIQAGVPALVQSVLKGKGAMPPRGAAGNASDADIRASVEYMVNAAR